MNDELFTLVSEWSVEQLTNYISQLETRIKNSRQLIDDLKYLRKSKERKLKDNGPRAGA